jgi:hypothetical protein
MGNNKIFIQIASYRDPQLLPTIRDAITNSKYPENLVFSITWQHSPDDEWDNLEEFKNDSRFKIIDIDSRKSEGACWARNLLQQQYDDEEFTLQLDSHHRFVKNWDEILITMYYQLKSKGIRKPLLTGYIPSFNPENDPSERVMTPWKMNFDRFIPEGAVFFLPASIDNYTQLTEPILSRFYSAHFAFASGDFVREVPHDPNYYFHGEEISIAVRAYTHGYDLFHPHKVVVWHEYTRKGRTKHWDDNAGWSHRNNECHLRNRKLFGMDDLPQDVDFGIYGFGKERTLEDYERFSGLSFKKRAVQRFTLDNNNPPNPPLYGEEFESSFLRIFKHCIDLYKPNFPESDYDFWAVIFEDKNDDPIYRQDADEQEVKELLKIKEGELWITLWRTFNTEIRPHHWVVWPHSKSKGWGEKIIGNLE